MIVASGYLSIVADEWKAQWNNKWFRLKLLLIPGAFIAYSFISQQLCTYVERREGIVLRDKLLMLIPCFDFSTEIFILLYTSLLVVLLTHLHKPRVVLKVIEMHFLVAIIRQFCILLVALEPPADIIVIKDVFLENTVYPAASPMTKDLFFSGHVASIWIYFLCADFKYLKVYLIFATLIMSIMVLSMRVHYTYDVYGGLFFTSVIYFFHRWITAAYGKAKQHVT